MIFKRKNILFLLGIFIICVIGFFLRAQETLSGNYLFMLDNGRDMMDVKKIVFDHKITLIGPYTSLGGVFQGPFYYYLLSIPTFIFGGDPWGNIILMLMISLLTMGVAYYFMRKYFGIIPAFITLALFAVSPEAISAATFFWNPHPMWLIITLYIFALYGSVNKKKSMMLFLFPIIALSFHFEMAFGVFLLVATTVYFIFFQRFLLRQKTFWVGVLCGLIFFIPQILFDLRHDFLMTRSVVEIIKGSNQGLIASGDKTGFVGNLINNFLVFKNNFLSSFINYKSFTYFPPSMAIFSFAILILLFYKKAFSEQEKKFLHATFSIIIIIFILCLIYPFPLRYWFLTGFQSFYLIPLGLVFAKIYKFNYGKIILTTLAVLFIFSSIVRINVLYFNLPDDGGLSKIKGKKAALDYIYKDAGNNKFSVLIFTPPVKSDDYDYLFWWYGGRVHGFVPENKKSGLTYLVMEPDPGKPWSYKGWLETVIKDGEILDTKNMSSGIIIQKRDFSQSN